MTHSPPFPHDLISIHCENYNIEDSSFSADLAELMAHAQKFAEKHTKHYGHHADTDTLALIAKGYYSGK
jgi:hypothetical protein